MENFWSLKMVSSKKISRNQPKIKFKHDSSWLRPHLKTNSSEPNIFTYKIHAYTFPKFQLKMITFENHLTRSKAASP